MKSKLEKAAREYATENMRPVDNDELDQFAIMQDTFVDAIKSEAAKEYWQSLTTPASNDQFIEKHLAIIKEKTIDNLIHVHIEGMGELEKASVKYFLETGKVNGSFLQRLKDLILSTPKYITPKPPASKEVEGIVKEAAVDFMWENERPNITSGYQAFRRLFDEWFSNNKYYQNKISKPHTVEEEAKPLKVIEQDDTTPMDNILSVEEGQTQEPVKCNGNCGMNYCDEYGCIENKPEGDVSHLLTPPPSPVGIDVEALAKDYAKQKDIDRWVFTPEQRHKFCIEDFKAGYSASLPQSSTEEEKELIIRGLEEGSELWKAEYDNCRAILTELVYLKNLKDSAGKTEEYEQRQPLVWITAKKFLEQYQHQ